MRRIVPLVCSGTSWGYRGYIALCTRTHLVRRGGRRRAPLQLKAQRRAHRELQALPALREDVLALLVDLVAVAQLPEGK